MDQYYGPFILSSLCQFLKQTDEKIANHDLRQIYARIWIPCGFSADLVTCPLLCTVSAQNSSQRIGHGITQLNGANPHPNMKSDAEKTKSTAEIPKDLLYFSHIEKFII